MKLLAQHLSPVFILLFFLSGVGTIYGQQEAPSVIHLHLKCQSCDETFIRQELDYVNHVRDLALSDVQLLINRVQNASGGSTFELYFFGRKGFEEQEQNLRYSAPPTHTSDEVRRGLLRRIEAGLLPYLLQTDMADEVELQVNGKAPSGENINAATDKWDSWIFEVYGEGNLETEATRSEARLEFGFEGDRITEEWRIRSDLRINYSEDEFRSDEETVVVVQRRNFARGSIVKSMGPHWSAGLFAGGWEDTFRNIRFAIDLAPAVEYSIFPYREVVRRELTFSYRMGYLLNNYINETIYEKLNESLLRQAFNIELRLRQPWGDVFSRVEASSYLHDLSKHRVEFDTFLSIRLYKGLAVRASAEIQLIRDQISLEKGDASIQDILLRQRQIATNFSTEIGIGLSYTFGAAFNNVVNMRL